MRLEGRVVIVTGGAQGLGKTYAQRLTAEGALVAIADINGTLAQTTAQEINALPIQTDVANRGSVQSMVDSVLQAYGKIDVLVNNAALFGPLEHQPIEDISVELWDRVMAINVRGVFLCCQAVGRTMLRAGRGSIVNIAATGGIKSFLPEMGPNLSYMASKAAVIKLTRDLAAQWAARGIRVNAIAPGSIAGGMMQSLPDDKLAPMVAQIPMRRQGRPDELRGAVAYLASEASSYVTGTVLVVDGGQSIV